MKILIMLLFLAGLSVSAFAQETKYSLWDWQHRAALSASMLPLRSLRVRSICAICENGLTVASAPPGPAAPNGSAYPSGEIPRSPMIPAMPDLI